MSMFDGQQDGERILYEASVHPTVAQTTLAGIIILSLLFFAIVQMIGAAVPVGGEMIRAIGTVLDLVFTIAAFSLTRRAFTKDRTYVTDRRIIRFDTSSPFVTTKRALFWNEVLKAKAYAPTMLMRMLNIGHLHIEPVMGEAESVRIFHLSYYEDLANYIDKILYTIKNDPNALTSFKPFIPKPKGERHSTTL